MRCRAAVSRRPQKLDELVELQFAVSVAVVPGDQSLDFVVAETEAEQGRFDFRQRHRAALVPVQFVEHLSNAIDPALTSTHTRRQPLGVVYNHDSPAIRLQYRGLFA